MMIAMFQKEEQSPQQVPIYSIGMQEIQIREGIKKNLLFLGKSPKLWVGGGQES